MLIDDKVVLVGPVGVPGLQALDGKDPAVLPAVRHRHQLPGGDRLRMAVIPMPVSSGVSRRRCVVLIPVSDHGQRIGAPGLASLRTGRLSVSAALADVAHGRADAVAAGAHGCHPIDGLRGLHYSGLGHVCQLLCAPLPAVTTSAGDHPCAMSQTSHRGRETGGARKERNGE